MALVRTLTQYLDPNEYGQLALVMTLVTLVGQVVMGGIGNGIGRYYSIAVEKEDLDNYWESSKELYKYAALIVTIFGILFISILWGVNESQWIGIATATVALSLLNGYSGILNSIQNAARQRAIVACHGGLESWMKIIIAVGIIMCFGKNSMSVIIGYIISAGLVCTSQYLFLEKMLHPKKKIKKVTNLKKNKWILDIWKFSWPFSAWGIFTWMQQASDKWALGIFGSTDQVGQYAVLFQLGYAPILMLTGLISSYIGPILYERSGDGTNQDRNQGASRITWILTKIGLYITIIGFIFLLFTHKLIFSYLVANQYRENSYLLPWFFIAGGLFASGQILSLKILSQMKPQKLIPIKIATSIIGILLNIVGAYFYGLKGVIGGLILFSLI